MEYTYDDVFIVPQYSDIESRFDVDLTPPQSSGMTIPVAVANMPPVTGKRMAETLARRGGVAVLPQYLPVEKVKKAVTFLKNCHSVRETPITVTKEDTIQTALGLIAKRPHGVAYVVSSDGNLIGVFSPADAKHHDLFTKVGQVMREDVFSVPQGMSLEEVYTEMEAAHLNVIPITFDVGHGGRKLSGAVTKKGLVRSLIYQPALDPVGRLLVAASVGVREGAQASAQLLIDLGVDIIVVDAAHGHQKRVIDTVRWIRSEWAGFIVAGNVVTVAGVRDLISAGANAVKVGVGPGATCTTRMMTGVGRPQFTAVKECAKVADDFGGTVWADGGVKHPRDLALALAAGASCVVIGTMFAGTYESAADLRYDEQGKPYKEVYGTSSRRSVDFVTRGQSSLERAKRLYLDEGVSSSRAYLQPGLEGAEDVLDRLTAGLRSAMTYTGARTVAEFQSKARVDSQTSSGYNEGMPRVGEWVL